MNNENVSTSPIFDPPLKLGGTVDIVVDPSNGLFLMGVNIVPGNLSLGIVSLP